jgi:hypothetical protein
MAAVSHAAGRTTAARHCRSNAYNVAPDERVERARFANIATMQEITR